MKNFILGILITILTKDFVAAVTKDVFVKMASKQSVQDHEQEKMSRGLTVNSKITSRYFGPDNQNWDGKPEHNEMFLRGVQNHMNNILQIKGNVTLNDVYEALGFGRTREGMVLGWSVDKGNHINISKEPVDDNHLLLNFIPHGLIFENLPTEQEFETKDYV